MHDNELSQKIDTVNQFHFQVGMLFSTLLSGFEATMSCELISLVRANFRGAFLCPKYLHFLQFFEKSHLRTCNEVTLLYDSLTSPVKI